MTDLGHEALIAMVAERDATIATQAARIEELEAHGKADEVLIGTIEDELTEMKATFDLRWKADQRAIKRWHDAGNDKAIWPDHADLMVWLLERLEAKDQTIVNMQGVIEAARVYIAHWTEHGQGDDWLNRRNVLAFKLGEALVDGKHTPTRIPPIPDLRDREVRNAWLKQIYDLPTGGTAPIEMVFYLAGLFAGIVSHLDKVMAAFDALRLAKEAEDVPAAGRALEDLIVAVSHIPELPKPSDPGSPVVRNLDQMFLRVTRKGKARTLCLTDCTWAEVEDWLQAQPLDPVSELAAVAQHLHERLRAVGDGLDLASGAFPEIPE